MEKLRNSSIPANGSDMSSCHSMNSFTGMTTVLMAVSTLKAWSLPELAFWRRLPQEAILGSGFRVLVGEMMKRSSYPEQRSMRN